MVGDEPATTSGEDGRWLVKHARSYRLLAEVHLTRPLLRVMVRRIAALPVPAG
jgi:hypothetical protein